MTAVLLELTARPIADDGIEMVDDVEAMSAFNRCSCSASDDNPYS